MEVITIRNCETKVNRVNSEAYNTYIGIVYGLAGTYALTATIVDWRAQLKATTTMFQNHDINNGHKPLLKNVNERNQENLHSRLLLLKCNVYERSLYL